MKNEILKSPYKKSVGKWYSSKESGIQIVFILDYVGLNHEGKAQNWGTPTPIFKMFTKTVTSSEYEYRERHNLATFVDFRTDSAHRPKFDPDQIETMGAPDGPFRRAWLFKRISPTPDQIHSVIKALFRGY